MSDIDISFEKLLVEDITIDDEQLDEADFIYEIIDDIVEDALVIAKEPEPAPVPSSEYVARSVITEILNEVSGENRADFHFTSSSSSSTAALETSSESSYRVPSYLAVFSQLEIPEEIVVEDSKEHTCEQYEDIDKYAGVVVDEILNKAIEYAVVHGVEETPQDTDWMIQGSTTSASSTVVEWPSIEAFNVEVGIKKIYEFMDTWDYEEDWLYCVDFLMQQSDDCSDYYKYEALWSIPTQMYPIPQATASIYFTVECSRVKPQHCPVTVTYIYEGTSYVHTLESAFSEDRLFEIVDSKLKFYQRLTF